MFRNNLNVIKKIKSVSSNQLSVSSITVAELLYGVKGIQSLEKKTLVKNFYNSFLEQCLVYNFDKKASILFADLKYQKRQEGRPVQDFDLMIASICLANKLTLVTNNTKHFNRIKDLKVVDWSSG
jgi:predicted nucleic acid-binding protein